MNPPFSEGVGVHTAMAMPERKLAFINSEAASPGLRGRRQPAVRGRPARGNHPMPFASFRCPGRARRAYTDFCFRAYRFGTHGRTSSRHPARRAST